ncbi:alpha/beta hydrolase [Microbacterium radiodurans]|uniref:Alpha/beta hydrolase n=1 Tax=Microbacterium radiodurans TaxID=661398 RepID=A0A5J5ISU1_9MICO|nr:alpha/beta hydrolase [Microbacterium radiodurans]KAA9089154.1 alpha/beta hydrolase [Microbacterium radiodurans]
MPLDPFFAERLRTHRRYLLRQAWTSLTGKVAGVASGWRGVPRPPAADGVPGTAPAGSTEPAPGPAEKQPARALTPRERHRRAALRWDRQELRTAGLAGPPIDTVEHRVPVPGHPTVRVRVYRPTTAPAADPAPAFLVFAGGAFRIGGIDYPTADAACRRRAEASGAVLIAIDYALAPEHRYPTQIEQAHAVWEWVHAEADALGIDPQRLGISGSSAGGCIAAALTLLNRDRSRHPIALQILEVPVTDLTGRHIDLRATYALGIPAFIAVRELVSVARTYLGDRSRARESYASPMRAASHRDLPPAVILTAEYDPLRADGAAYAAKLRRAGVEASATRYLGVTHDTPLYVGALPAARRWEAEVVAAMRRI